GGRYSGSTRRLGWYGHSRAPGHAGRAGEGHPAGPALTPAPDAVGRLRQEGPLDKPEDPDRRSGGGHPAPHGGFPRQRGEHTETQKGSSHHRNLTELDPEVEAHQRQRQVYPRESH